MIYIVVFNIQGPSASENYSKMLSAMKAFGKWARLEASSWLIQTDLTTNETTETLKVNLNPNDLLFVGRLSDDWSGFNLGENRLAWIKTANFR